MALEDALTANTAAVTKHNELLTKLLASGKGGAAAPETKAAAPKAADKKAETKAKPAVGKGKVKVPTPTEVRTAYGDYLNGGEDEGRDDRIAEIGKVNAHFGIGRIGEVPAERTVEALKYLEQLKAGEELVFEDAGEGEAAGEDDSPI